MKERTNYPSIDKRHEDECNFLEKHPFIPKTSVYKLYRLSSTFSTAKIISNGAIVSTSDFNKEIDNISRSLGVFDIHKGDRITICASHIRQNLSMFLGANRIGAGVAIINSKSSLYNMVYYLNKFNSEVFVCYDLSREVINEIKRTTNAKYVININPTEIGSIYQNEEKRLLGYDRDDILSFNDFTRLASYNKGKIIESNDPNNIAYYGFTSGSSGLPKITQYTNENIIAASLYMKNGAKTSLKNDERILAIVDDSYPYGFLVSKIMTLLSRKDLMFSLNYNLSNISESLAMKPSIIFGIPPFYTQMIKDPEVDKMDLSFIKHPISGGGPLSAEENIEITDFLHDHGSNAVVENGAGAAETASSANNAVNRIYKPFTVGYILPGTNQKVIDPITKKELKYGEEGQLCYSGKNVIDSYFDNPEATSKSFMVDEKGIKWFVSDTLGIIYPDGTVKMSGRGRNFMTSPKDGGMFKVDCDFIQRCIQTFPEVSNCVVVGKKHDTLGSVGKVYLEINPKYKDYEKIEDIIWGKCYLPIHLIEPEGPIEISLKPYEIPLEFEIVDQILINDADKIDICYYEQLANTEHGKVLEKNYNKSIEK